MLRTAILAAVSDLAGDGQQSESVHMVVQCVNALPGKGGDSEKIIMENTRKAMQARVDEGSISSRAI